MTTLKRHPLKSRAEKTACAAEFAMKREPGTPLGVQERAIVNGYCGMGPMAGMFDNGRGGFVDPDLADEGARLRAAMDPNDYDELRAAILTSYFTPGSLAEGMVKMLRKAGVGPGASVLEPGCGTGKLLDACDPDWILTGIERDPLAARIAALKHPHATILKRDLRDTPLDNAFDGVIGNVPFGETRYRWKGHALTVADYFIARSIDALRPGGVAVLLTSHGFLDKADSTARDDIAGKARLINALRLPSNVFADDGAAVITDLIVFQRTVEGDPSQAWTQSAPRDALDGLTVNAWFDDNPEKVLGTIGTRSGPYGPRLAVEADETDVSAEINNMVGRLQIAAPAPKPQPQSVDIADADAIEGQLGIYEDGAIREVVNGCWKPCLWRKKPLRETDRTPTGPRTAALIRLAEQRERIVRAQIDGIDPAQIDVLRSKGITLWQQFCRRFGPINEAVHKETPTGDQIRHPQLEGPFKRDPRLAIVCAMEAYDETTGQAQPGAVLTKDVVTACEEPTSARDAKDALMISLSWRARVDLAYMGALTGQTEATILAELGDLVFFDPALERHVVCDEYLSGNVRGKLDVARCAAERDSAFLRNVEALEAVQPIDLTEEDIDLRLGTPIVEPDEMAKFAQGLFASDEAGFGVVRVGDDTWKIGANGNGRGTVQAQEEFGTSRYNGVDLLESLLNQRVIQVYDEIKDGNARIRVLNTEETVAAREKAAAIEAAFKAWVFAPPRCAAIVERYNRAYNNRRARQFDGSHLDFPGLELGTTLRPHQANAVWRSMAGTTCTLWAHHVGAGKTSCVAALVSKMRRMGAQRAIFTVPNHLTTQQAMEVVRFFPMMKVLVAETEDVREKALPRFLAKVQSCDADLVIIGHSAFERIGVSKATEEAFVQSEIAELRDALVDAEYETSGSVSKRAKRMIESQIDKAKTRLETIRKRKERAITFETLGCDLLCVDEAHYGKNLTFQTKMSGVQGLNPNGSQRASDLLMKVRLVQNASPFSSPVTFLTATPISNSISEVWVMGRYLCPEILAEAKISTFDSFAASFCEVSTDITVSPDGKTLEPSTRLARFRNLPELLAIWSEFADVVTQDMSKIALPEIAGGEPERVMVDLPDSGTALQLELVERLKAIRNRAVGPKEDNALAVTTDGRLLSLDPRLIDPGGEPGEVLPTIAENAAEIYRETAAQKGVQIIFMSMGVNPSPRTGFSAYDELTRLLIEAGIPSKAIVNSRDDVKTKTAEARVHDGLRKGRYRVYIVSDAKGGTGLNIAERLVALHNADLPWRPSDMEQRIGRIIRQCATAEQWARRVITYVAKRSFASRILALLESKAKMIHAVMTAEIDLRTIDDIGDVALNYAEMMAVSTGDPAIMVEAEITGELRRLCTLRTMHGNARRRMRNRVEWLESFIQKNQQKIERLRGDIARRDAARNKGWLIEGRCLTGDAAKDALRDVLSRTKFKGGGKIGEFYGFPLRLVFGDLTREWSLSVDTSLGRTIDVSRKASGVIQSRVEDFVMGLEGEIARTERTVREDEKGLADTVTELGKAFPMADAITALETAQVELRAELGKPAEQRDRDAVNDIIVRFRAIKSDPGTTERGPARERDIAVSAVTRAMMDRPTPDEAPGATAPVQAQPEAIPAPALGTASARAPAATPEQMTEPPQETAKVLPMPRPKTPAEQMDMFGIWEATG